MNKNYNVSDKPALLPTSPNDTGATEQKLVHNFTDLQIPNEVLEILKKGANFALTPKRTQAKTIEGEIQKTVRRVLLRNFFKWKVKTHTFFRNNNSKWIPNSNITKECIEIGKQIFNQFHEEITSNRYYRYRDNIKEDHVKIMSWLENNNIKIVEADKNLGLILINKLDYEERIATEIMLTPDAFRELNMSISELHANRVKSFRELRHLLELIHPDIGHESLIKFMIPSTECFDLNIAEVKGLPKIHKKGKRMRLIYPMDKHIFRPIHSFIACCLEPIVTRFKSVITNVIEIVQQISGTYFPENTLFFTADINNMYPSIDRLEAINISAKLLAAEFPRLFPQAEKVWHRIITIAYTDLEYKFQNKLYERIEGVSMGSPAGPQMAIAYLHEKIKNRWENLKDDMIFGGFYFDDLFIIFKPYINKSMAIFKINELLNDTSLFFDKDSFNIRSIRELRK